MRCPSVDVLELWLDEQLGDTQQHELEQHIGACGHCQSALERLTEKTVVLSEMSSLPRLGANPADTPPPFLERLKQPPPGGPLLPPAGPKSAAIVPPAIEGYEILGELGRGGMGVVYKARQTALNRLVALKVILSGAHAAPKDRERFRQEAEAVARLHHPNIVQIYDIGDAEGGPYLVLEYVEQGSLAQRLHGEPQPLEPTVRLIETLARAIHFAHQHHLVHRDLKPANILLSTPTAEDKLPPESPEPAAEEGSPPPFGIAKITDFGLAKRLDQQASRSNTEELLGTPSYMAPEQADARAPRIGPATDVYALGAILYEMLTGRPPFRAASALETMLQVLHEEPIRPSRLRPNLPRDLETICLKCLEKTPSRRYASAAALADDLRRFRRGDPIEARPVGPLERGWKWACRRPVYAGLTVGIVLVALLGFAGVTHQWRVAVWERNGKEEQTLQALNALYYSRITQSQLQWRANDARGALASLLECIPEEGHLDRRGWEWYHLHTLYHSDLLTLKHSRGGAEGSVAFQPGGGAIASILRHAGAEGESSELRLWDAVRGTVLHEQRLAAPFHRLAFRPDGKRLVLGGADGSVAVWDIESGRELRHFAIHDTRIAGLAFSPDGRSVASAAITAPDHWPLKRGEVKLWDADTGAVRWTLSNDNAQGFHSVAFHPRLPLLATGGEDTVVRLWDRDTGAALGELTGHKYAVFGVAFSPDGRLLVSAASNGSLKIWDVEACRKVLERNRRRQRRGNAEEPELPRAQQTLTGRTGAILGLAFSPDGRYFAYSGTDNTVRVWDVEAGMGLVTFRGHGGLVESVQFSPDGQRLVSASPTQGEVKVWDFTRHPEYATLAHVATDVEGIAFHEDGERLVSVTVEGQLQIWDAASGMLRGEHRLALSGEPVQPAGLLTAFSPDGRRLAARPRESSARVRIWDVDSGQALLTLQGHTLPVHCLCFSADGRRLATCACDREQTGRPHEIKIWDAESGKLLAALQGQGRLFTAAFSPDGRWLAVGGSEGMRVLDWAASRTLVRLPSRRGASVTALAFRPDGRRLACAGIEEGKVHLWDCSRWNAAPKEPAPLRTMAAPRLLCDLDFSPDGSRLAGASRDGFKMWDADTGVEVLSLRGAPQRYRDPPFNARIVFHPDGSRLAGTNWNESISVWEAPRQIDDEARLQQQRERRRAADERALYWHLQEAEYCIEHHNETAARFHVDRLGNAALPALLHKRKQEVIQRVQGVSTPR